MVGRGVGAGLGVRPASWLITSMRTSVPSAEAKVTCRVLTSGTSTAPGAVAQTRTAPSRAS